MNLCAFFFIIEIFLLIYLLKLIYKPCILERIENFVLRKEPGTNDVEPKLKALSDKVSKMFSDDVKYTGILSNVNKKRMLNEISLFKGNKSYTINKEHIYMCLKDEDNNYYDDNMLIYVLIHEIAHSICDEIGHTRKFHKIFDALLEKAQDMNIYDPNLPLVRNYCNYSNSN
jgi:hypothetical protein